MLSLKSSPSNRFVYFLHKDCLTIFGMNSESNSNPQVKNLVVKHLSAEEKLKLENDTAFVSDFKREKLEKEARKNWDLFYKRNKTNFFKDRHWTKREFQELCEKPEPGQKLVLLEVGCGVGNFLFPLLEEDKEKEFFFYACDFSPRAVLFVKENPQYDENHCNAFTCDVTEDPIIDTVPPESVDIATLIFVLSAINPNKMKAALINLKKALKPGGVLLFRDYGLYDHAMLRFAPGHKISSQFYVRQDGTRAYYFTTEEVEALCKESGYDVIECDYVTRQTVNKKEGLSAERIFVQARCRAVNLEENKCTNDPV